MILIIPNYGRVYGERIKKMKTSIRYAKENDKEKRERKVEGEI